MNDTPQQRPDRPDDSGYNNPSKSPKQTRPLSEKESEQFNREGSFSDPGMSQWTEKEGANISPVRILEKARRLLRTSLSLVILGLIIVGLFIYAATLNFITTVVAYPNYLQWPVWLLLGLILVLVLYAFVRLLALWGSLHRHPQVSLAQVDETDRVQAKTDLANYLKKLASGGNQQASKWNRFWPDEPDQATALLEACRKLSKDRHIDVDSWLEEFNELIRKPMDQAASRRIRKYWRLVGIKTAISPFPLIDSMAVLYNNFLMIGDLSILYGRKISKAEIFILLWIIIFQVYIATQSQEILESVADEMTQSIQSGIARSVTQFFSPKLAEGTIHAMVTWRVGKRAMSMMHPIMK